MSRLLASPNVVSLLDAHLPHQADAAWYRAGEIPAKKLKNAIGKYASAASEASVLALGDGTVFGSAKEGILITADTFFGGTSEGKFSVPLQSIVSAKRLGGWPTYGVELECRDGQTHITQTHIISMSCFEKQQAGLIEFLNSTAQVGMGSVENNHSHPIEEHQGTEDPQPVSSPLVNSPPWSPQSTAAESAADLADTSVRAVNAGLKLMSVCPRDGYDDTGALFEAAFREAMEWPLLKGHCQYVGYSGRKVDGVFLLTNRRLMLFSTERGAKIVFVETTRSLLGKVPVPFFDSLACFLLFSIPRSIYVALRGGKEAMIIQALSVGDDQLLSQKPPLRKVQEFDFAKLAQTTAQAEIGSGVCTGILGRAFGVSFSPAQLTKTFSVPKDLILAGHATLEPFERLLHAIRTTLAGMGLGYRLDAKGQKLTIVPIAAEQKAAA